MWTVPVHCRHKPNESKLAVDGDTLEMDVSTVASHADRVGIVREGDMFNKSEACQELENANLLKNAPCEHIF